MCWIRQAALDAFLQLAPKGDEHVIRMVTKMLEDEDEAVRMGALQALVELCTGLDRDVACAITALLEAEYDENVRQAAVDALVQLAERQALVNAFDQIQAKAGEPAAVTAVAAILAPFAQQIPLPKITPSARGKIQSTRPRRRVCFADAVRDEIQEPARVIPPHFAQVPATSLNISRENVAKQRYPLMLQAHIASNGESKPANRDTSFEFEDDELGIPQLLKPGMLSVDV